MLTTNQPSKKNRMVSQEYPWLNEFPSTNPCVILSEQSESDGPIGWSQTNDAFSRRDEVSRRNMQVQKIAEYLSGALGIGSGSGIMVVCEIAEESSRRGADLLEEEYRDPYGRLGPLHSDLAVGSDELESATIELAIAELAVVQSVADIVAEVRERLSLSVTELAAILKVGRPTVYAWLRGDSDPHQRNLDRLELVKGIAAEWWALTGRPVYRHLRHSFDESGRSLFGMLKADPIELGTIREHFERLAQLPEKRPVSVKELATKHGISAEPKSDSEGDREMAVTKRFATDVDATDDQQRT